MKSLIIIILVVLFAVPFASGDMSSLWNWIKGPDTYFDLSYEAKRARDISRRMDAELCEKYGRGCAEYERKKEEDYY